MLVSQKGKPEWNTVDHLPLPSEEEYFRSNPEFYGGIRRHRNRKQWFTRDIEKSEGAIDKPKRAITNSLRQR